MCPEIGWIQISNWDLIWNALSSVATVLSFLITIFIYILARKELKKSNSISELDLYYRLKADLFSDFAISVYRSILDDRLKFVNESDDDSYFMIDHEKIQTSDFGLNFLGHLEDISLFLDEGIITYEKINAGFGSFILEVGNSEPVVEYIKYVRNVYQDSELWSGFEKVYLEIHRQLSIQQRALYRPQF